jgi:hypothetical protein
MKSRHYIESRLDKDQLSDVKEFPKYNRAQAFSSQLNHFIQATFIGQLLEKCVPLNCVVSRRLGWTQPSRSYKLAGARIEQAKIFLCLIINSAGHQLSYYRRLFTHKTNPAYS